MENSAQTEVEQDYEKEVLVKYYFDFSEQENDFKENKLEYGMFVKADHRNSIKYDQLISWLKEDKVNLENISSLRYWHPKHKIFCLLKETQAIPFSEEILLEIKAKPIKNPSSKDSEIRPSVSEQGITPRGIDSLPKLKSI
jgi:hypothetical protein